MRFVLLASLLIWAFIFAIFYAAFGADLVPPRHLIQIGRSPVRAPELCLQTGRKPFPGQTLQQDDTCPTKLRWVFQK